MASRASSGSSMCSAWPQWAQSNGRVCPLPKTSARRRVWRARNQVPTPPGRRRGCPRIQTPVPAPQVQVGRRRCPGWGPPTHLRRGQVCGSRARRRKSGRPVSRTSAPPWVASHHAQLDIKRRQCCGHWRDDTVTRCGQANPDCAHPFFAGRASHPGRSRQPDQISTLIDCGLAQTASPVPPSVLPFRF